MKVILPCKSGNNPNPARLPPREKPTHKKHKLHFSKTETETDRQELSNILKNLSEIIKCSLHENNQKPSPNLPTLFKNDQRSKQRIKPARSKRTCRFPKFGVQSGSLKTETSAWKKKFEPRTATKKPKIHLTFSRGPVKIAKKPDFVARERGKTFETAETKDSEQSRVPNVELLIKMVQLQKSFQRANGAKNAFEHVLSDSEQSSILGESSASDSDFSETSENKRKIRDRLNLFDSELFSNSQKAIFDEFCHLDHVKMLQTNETEHAIWQNKENEFQFHLEIDEELHPSLFPGKSAKMDPMEAALEQKLVLWEIEEEQMSASELESELELYLNRMEISLGTKKMERKKQKRRFYCKEVRLDAEMVAQMVKKSREFFVYNRPMTSLKESVPQFLLANSLIPFVTRKFKNNQKWKLDSRKKPKTCKKVNLPHMRNYQRKLWQIGEGLQIGKKKLPVFEKLNRRVE